MNRLKGDYYFTELSNQPLVAQLQQLTHLTWDGDLISKDQRSDLVKSGYAQRFNNGWNLITKTGIEYLERAGFIQS